MPVLACSGEVEDGDSGGFAARAGCRGNRDQRFDRPRNRLAPADGRIDVIQEIRRVATVKVGRLRRVDCRTAADRDKRVEVVRLGGRNGFAKRFVRGLHADAVENRRANLVLFERFQHRGNRRQVAQVGIGEDQDVLLAKVRQFRAHFPRYSETDADGGSRHLECVFVHHPHQLRMADSAEAANEVPVHQSILLTSSSRLDFAVALAIFGLKRQC